MSNNPQPKLNADALYMGDNGRVLHGKCSGASAKYSGRDISGQRVLKLTPAMRQECAAMGMEPKCEKCGGA